MNHLVVVGSINADLTVHVSRHPHPGETLIASGGEITAGGKGANQAVAAARLGARVRVVGAIGTDANATPATEHLRGAGVDLSDVAVVPGPTGLAVITVDAEGENSILVVPGANSRVDGAYVRAHAAPIAAADLVLLQGEIPASGFEEAVRAATARVVINLAPVVPVPREALLVADPLIANEHEAALILAQLGEGEAPASPGRLAEALCMAGFRTVILTLGGRGAVVAEAGLVTHVPTPAITPVDTTGAGDAFTGALCSRLLAGDPLLDAARFSARVGAYSATIPGAQASYPWPDTALPSC